MVNRIYVEKREAYRQASEKILHELRDLYGLKGLTALRLLQRYDVEELSPDLLERAKRQIFSDPPLDIVREELDTSGADFVLRVEYLPGQYDQKADSAAQCIQVLGEVERPLIRTARVFLFYGTLGPEDEEKIRRYLINPVESREAAAEKAQTLKREPRELPPIPDLPGFRELDEAALARFLETYALAMDLNDLRLTRDYFRQEGRDPSETEIRILDTYWSDHCRHSTFLTELKQVQIDDPDVRASYEDYLAKRAEIGRTKPVSLMDLGTFAGRYLRKKSRLPNVDESEEVNACTIKMPLKRNGKDEDWLLFFKNETHNHPTEIEPFGGAATCIGGAIRDPLSGRAYVHAAMRLTGAADPTVPVSETLPGKLPQRKLVTTAADGYSSYGNQIGLATGMVDEIYHAGYRAKRLEVGAVIAAAPASQVLREEPAPGDVVLLLGGRTGRDGIGGATGSSKSHHIESVQESGSEVQKGNAPEERKLQRFFRHPEASRCIKRCNDFGAGGVSVAVGELAPGLEINLDAVPKKYDGLNGTELAISESQERMAICVTEKDVAIVSRVAAEENLEISRIATVTAEPRLRMFWRGERIVDLSRDFLDSNGASREADARVGSASPFSLEDALEDAQRGRGGKAVSGTANSEAAAASAPPASRLADLSFREACLRLAGDLNICSKQGLVERFDSTVGANTVLMPYGGREQMTPIQTMVHRIPLLDGQSERVSFMSWGFNPMITERDPWRGAYWAVVESVSKLIAAGSDRREIYLSFQEYFERLRREPERWGKVLAALLGAYQAQMDLGIAAIGGKDSMSGSFENLDVLSLIHI